MKLNRLTAVAAAAALALTGLVATTAPAQAAAAKPALVIDYGHHKVKVKPKAIYPYKDLYFTGIHWTSLTSTTGYATATQNVNTCIPSCADANYKRTKVKLKFTKVKLSDCRRVFSRVTVTQVKSKKVATHTLPVFAKKGC
ncbi:hypothetical protein [Actinoplanes palleronii]|uniref:Uncharacterized protein n=1 Tax=Actinoplanes palleronii TaxID=113570 RepID=A0ABQ4B5X6_9ACTN|nr:hypothetical protein [Actinoplanes palleronii]GIE66050.1 hypothetical protein Apa02nite_021580 [Actinoplanes palleronii]